MVRDGEALTEYGISFQRIGAAISKDLSPRVFLIFFRGNWRRLSVLKRKWYLVGTFRVTSYLRYGGAWLLRILKVRSRILNCIRNLIGSQWSEDRTGVMWLNRGVFVISRAAVF